MSLLPAPLGTGMMTPIGAPPVAAQPSGLQQFASGLLGNPLIGMGIGLLSGAQPGGTFAGGAQLGLINAMNMQRQQQATALMGARLEEMRRKRQAEERQQRNLEGLTQMVDPLTAAYMQAGRTPPAAPQPHFFQGGVEGRPGQRVQMMYDPATNQAIPVPGAAPTTPTPQVVIQGDQAEKVITPSDAMNMVNAEGKSPPIGATYGDAQQGGFFMQSQTAQTEYRKKQNALDRTARAAQDYAKLLDEYGTTMRPGEGKARLERAYARWQLQEKEAAELGALTGPDIGMLTRQLADPTSWYTQMQGIDAAKAQMNDYMGALEGERSSTAQQYRRNFEPLDWQPFETESATEQPAVRTVTEPPAWATPENEIQPLGTRRSRRLR